MPRLRWGSVRPTDVDTARERLIDAAEVCFDQFGESKTTIEDVAAQAQVSRATAYRYFRGRDDVVAAVTAREALAVADELRTIVDSEPDDDRAIEAGLSSLLASVRKNPRLRAVVERTDDAEIDGGARGALFDPLVGRASERSDVDADALRDWLSVVVTGLVATFGRSLDEDRNLIEAFVVPVLLSRR